MEHQEPRQQFRFENPGWLWLVPVLSAILLVAVPLYAGWCWVMVRAKFVEQLQDIEHRLPQAQQGDLAALLHHFDALGCASYAVWTALHMRRWASALGRMSIEIDDQGIALPDRSGRQKQIAWNAIEEVAVISCAGLCRPKRVGIRAGGEMTWLSAWIQHREALLNEVVSRANLQKSEENWYRTLYWRPPESRR